MSTQKHPSIKSTSGQSAAPLTIYESQHLILSVGEPTWIQCEDQTRHWPWTITVSATSRGDYDITLHAFTLTLGTTDNKGHYSVGWVYPDQPPNPTVLTIPKQVISANSTANLQVSSQAWVACSASGLEGVAVTLTAADVVTKVNLVYDLAGNTPNLTVKGTIIGTNLYSA
ncbi:hypothetical protein [Sorangium sp. So ce1389]|uniref:hypothetical protein n=1 Tax=Sorangium sp. So ce1389 TaxID=3133336 RepID=UPI003F611A36